MIAILENLITLYSGGYKPRWVRPATCFLLASAGYLLFKTAGGFPPKAWSLLLDVLPRLPSLWMTQGAGVLLPLIGLLLFSFSLLVLWSVIVFGIGQSLVRLWIVSRQQGRFQTDLNKREWSMDEPAPSQPHLQLAYAMNVAPTQPEVDAPDLPMTAHSPAYNPPMRASLWEEQRLGASPTSQLAELTHQFQPLSPQQIQPLRGAVPAYDPLPQNAQARTYRSGTLREHLRLVPDQTGPAEDFSEDDEYRLESTQPLLDTRPIEVDEESIGISQIPTAIHRNWNEEDDEQEATLRLVIGIGLDPGLVRKDRPNEDSLFAIQGIRTTEDGPVPAGLFVIADGMGGHANGRDASRLAVQEISNIIVPALLRDDSGSSRADNDEQEFLLNLLKDGVKRANLAILQQNRNRPHMMGTTTTAALIVNTTAYIINVGDSRTYLYRAADGLVQITRDHSTVARLVEIGEITQDEIYTHPQRNQIYRCLGEYSTLELDTFVVPLQPDDILLLCSDGLWEMVRDPAMEKIITTSSHLPAQISNILVQAALNEGGVDNISVITVGIVETTL